MECDQSQRNYYNHKQNYIQKKKKKVSWANTGQGPLMMTTYVYGKMKKKTNKKKAEAAWP